MNRVRCKMKLATSLDYAHWAGKELTFNAEYDPNIPEDQRFAKATPQATFKMTVDNPAAFEVLKLGKSFYVDFSPAD